MRLKIASPFDLVPTAVRLILILLAGITVWMANGRPERGLIGLGGGYVVSVIILAAFRGRQRTWVAYPSTLIDVGAATTFLHLLPQAQLPVWTLYLFPLAIASSSGVAPSLLAIALCLAGYLSAVGDPRAASLSVIWPLAVLPAAGIGILLLPSRWLAMRREKYAWDQVLAARRLLQRERSLSQAALEITGCFERNFIRDAVARAAASALRGEAELVDLDSEAVHAGRGGQDTMDTGTELEVLPLGSSASVNDALTIVVKRDLPLDKTEQAWLAGLGQLAGAALNLAAQHEQLRREEARLRSIWQELPAPAVLSDAAGNAVLANTHYRTLEERGLREIQGGVVVDEPPQIFMPAETDLAGGEYRLRLLREVTEEREALKAKDDLLSLVGHELRGPLTSIHGFSQLMARNLTVVQQQVVQLDRLISDLMNESSLQSGQLSLDLHTVDMRELAQAAVERFKGGHEGREIELELDEVVPVRADPARFNQVIENLLNNAVKYSPAKSEILVSVGMREGEVTLSVKDNGVGIAAEHLPHLFDRFYRAPGTETRHIKGLGLGLSIVRDLIVAHGGRVWAESEGPGRGTTFWVSLPAWDG